MTRYIISIANKGWLMALYDTNSSGVTLTGTREDACSWVTYEAAQAAALQMRSMFSDEIRIEATEEPLYPRSWEAVVKI